MYGMNKGLMQAPSGDSLVDTRVKLGRGELRVSTPEKGPRPFVVVVINKGRGATEIPYIRIQRYYE